MSSIDSLARSPRPTSEVFNNISQKQRQISFAIYEGEEINLSDPNLNYANGPGFLSTPNDSQTDVSATQDLQRDPTIMNEHAGAPSATRKEDLLSDLNPTNQYCQGHCPKPHLLCWQCHFEQWRLAIPPRRRFY